MFSTSLALFLGAAAVAAQQNCSAIIVTNETTKQDCLDAGECTYTKKCDDEYGMPSSGCLCVDGRVNLTKDAYGVLSPAVCENCHGYVADLEAKDAMNMSSKTTCVARCEDFTGKESCNAKLGCNFKEDPQQYGEGKCETNCKSYDADGAIVKVDEEKCSGFPLGCHWKKDPNSQYNTEGKCEYVAEDKCTSHADCQGNDLYSQCTGEVGKKECTCLDDYVSENGVCKGKKDAACTNTNGCSGDNVCYKDTKGNKCALGKEECTGTCAELYVASETGSTQNFVESSYSSAAPTSLVVLFVALFCSA